MHDASQARPAPPEATSTEPVLRVQGLTKRYGAAMALDDLTFALEPGTITGLLGPNGAGKTTTLRLVLGLARPTSGTATVFGVPYAQLPDPSRRVGALLESDDFDPGRSGRNHLRVLALAAGVDQSRVDQLLELVELTSAADRAVRTYSLGMRQRLGLAAALLGDPEVLILDEPGNGLDPAGVHWLRGLLRDLARAGRTVLVSSHVLAEVAQTVDAVLILSHGRLAAEQRMTDLPHPSALEALYLQATAQATG